MEKKIYNLNEEEYQFQSSSDSGENFSSGNIKSEAANILERINRQNILTGFLLIFLIFGFYKIFHGLFYNVLKPSVVENNKHKANPDVVRQTEMANASNNAFKRLENLAQQQMDIRSSIQELNSDVSDLQSALVGLRNQVSQINDGIQAIYGSQQKIIQDQRKSLKKTIVKKEILKPVYYVRAMIPGRVWLTTPEGATSTLSVGDKLTGYGILDSINVKQGLITFDSGAIIGYSPNDR